VAEGEDMAAMADVGTLDLSRFEHSRWPLKDVNKLMASLEGRDSGLTNFVVMPGTA
jgi:alcohol dehydrogenase